MLGVLLDPDGVEPVQQPAKSGYSIHDFVNRDGRKAVVMEGSIIAMPRTPHVYAFSQCPHLAVKPPLDIFSSRHSRGLFLVVFIVLYIA